MKAYVEQAKALGDVTRLRIMRLICESRQALCVCELMDALKVSHCNISRHLKILKITGIVEEQKEGRWVHFSVANPGNLFHKNLLRAVGDMPSELFADDIERLKARLSLREDGKCVDGLNSEKWKATLKLIRSENISHGIRKRSGR